MSIPQKHARIRVCFCPLGYHQVGAPAQQPSSPAAASVERRHDERSCRRSGAAPCCACVGALQFQLMMMSPG